MEENYIKWSTYICDINKWKSDLNIILEPEDAEMFMTNYTKNFNAQFNSLKIVNNFSYAWSIAYAYGITILSFLDTKNKNFKLYLSEISAKLNCNEKESYEIIKEITQTSYNLLLNFKIK